VGPRGSPPEAPRTTQRGGISKGFPRRGLVCPPPGAPKEPKFVAGGFLFRPRPKKWRRGGFPWLKEVNPPKSPRKKQTEPQGKNRKNKTTKGPRGCFFSFWVFFFFFFSPNRVLIPPLWRVDPPFFFCTAFSDFFFLFFFFLFLVFFFLLPTRNQTRPLFEFISHSKKKNRLPLFLHCSKSLTFLSFSPPFPRKNTDPPIPGVWETR